MDLTFAHPKHTCTVITKNFRLLFHLNTKLPCMVLQSCKSGYVWETPICKSGHILSSYRTAKCSITTEYSICAVEHCHKCNAQK